MVHVPDDLDLRAIRKRLALTRAEKRTLTLRVAIVRHRFVWRIVPPTSGLGSDSEVTASPRHVCVQPGSGHPSLPKRRRLWARSGHRLMSYVIGNREPAELAQTNFPGVRLKTEQTNARC